MTIVKTGKRRRTNVKRCGTSRGILVKFSPANYLRRNGSEKKLAVRAAQTCDTCGRVLEEDEWNEGICFECQKKE